jgi:hypothetical protein
VELCRELRTQQCRRHRLSLMSSQQCRRHRLEPVHRTAWAAGAPLLHPRTSPGRMLAAEAEGLAAGTSAELAVPSTASAEAGALWAALAEMRSHDHHLEEAAGEATAGIPNSGSLMACQAKDCTRAEHNFGRRGRVSSA